MSGVRTFVPWPDDWFIRHLERNGYDLRRRLKLGDREALDPNALIETYENISVLDLRSVLTPATAVVLKADIRGWSALAYREANGPWLVVSNPWHSETRRRVSLMEEVAHIVLGHSPTKMVPDPVTGLPRRCYSRSKEKEAYGVAGAALVPYNGLHALRGEGRSVHEIAKTYGVSLKLVDMRTKVTRLHK